ncbi:DNA-methyltransferase [Phaeobacter sp. JH209A]|uniref:DNA-methyltransferase n=1 Tax=Phaeobacter sp. JH209A TaxID=3112505 RepID=UPI003A846AD6
MTSAYVAKEVIADCTLYQGDMRAVLPELEEKADLCVTDPPYRLTSGGRGKTMGGKFHPDQYDNKGDLMQVLPWAKMPAPIFAALKEDADAYVMTNSKHVARSQIAFEAGGFKHHELLTWDKGAVTRQPFYLRCQEFTHYLWKGRARHIADGGAKTRFACAAPKDHWHPTAKPTSLMALYVLQSSDLGDLVIDPFAGSAATLIAALAFGRRAIGVELEPRFFDLACEAVTAAYADGFAQVRAAWDRDRLANNIRGLAHAA